MNTFPKLWIIFSFSSGYKQLLCLCRAILKKPKFLVLDEVTANCDKNIESLIQKIVKEQFKESTVLIVAHRINTLLECDRLDIINLISISTKTLFCKILYV